MNDYIRLPRLYVDQDFTPQGLITLSEGQNHYLRSVLRRNPGDGVRLFNGRDGEFSATLETLDKKAALARLVTPLKAQPAATPALHLLFAPIKKTRLEWLLEKAVELGATHLHPVITQNTELRTLNHGRVEMQLIEAAEQCERLTIPHLSPILPLKTVISSWNSTKNVIFCAERADSVPFIGKIIDKNDDIAVLIGPEGGFSAEENEYLTGQPVIQPASLGAQILRSETAVCMALATVAAARAKT